LSALDDGRSLYPRHVRAVERRRLGRRTVRARACRGSIGDRSESRAGHVVARVRHHDRRAARRAASAGRRGLMARPTSPDVRVRKWSAGQRTESPDAGVCGAVLIEDLRRDLAVLPAGPSVEAALLPSLVERMRSGQGVFDRTGGLHAAGLFDAAGELICMREDVGRHNAVDKVVGRMLLDGRIPARDAVLAVSGRAGYEIVQKSITAGIPVLAAVGAPSSLAVAL